ncbi:hypothetical protein ACO2Q7_07660 [Rathayibacter sp. KR2-224]|uniref:hypothetical protein n=1 Tax=Rathayibacter sp. KR2-224 TaxID=3400913 RepID=UPI003BFD4D0F
MTDTGKQDDDAQHAAEQARWPQVAGPAHQPYAEQQGQGASAPTRGEAGETVQYAAEPFTAEQHPEPFAAEQYPTLPVDAGQDPDQLSAPPEPKKKRTGLLAGIVGGGVLLVLLIAGGVWFAFESSAHTPQAAVQPFMDALVKGDVAQIVKTGNIDTNSPLVTEKAYAATKDRISGYSIKPAGSQSNTASVFVSYKQGSDRHSETLELKKSGTDLLFFTRWTLVPVTLPTVKVTANAPGDASVQVNGVAVGIDNRGNAELQALPGRYDVTLATSANYTAQSQTATISVINASTDAAGSAVKLNASLTDAGKAAAVTAVNAWVSACTASTELQPAGCSFGLINDLPGVHLSNAKWTLVTPPTFSVGAWDGAGWAVDTVTPGSATFLADGSADDGSSGQVTSIAPVNVAVEGEITGFDKSGNAIFQSIDWTGKASLPTA